MLELVVPLFLPLLAAFAIPMLARFLRGAWLGRVLALVPLYQFFSYLSLRGTVAEEGSVRVFYPWLSTIGIDFSLSLDGLSLLMALLISGIGFLIFIYGGDYFGENPKSSRFWIVINLFLMAMLGVVSSNNLFLLFVFWELTSFSSYLLVGYKHEDEAARKSALNALLITGGGGLCLFAGIVLLGIVGGTYEWSELLTKAELIRSHSLYLPIFVLFFLGAATKSALMPFHFWLPGAMVAPTPVSAYLHSATMVKAGIYLLARVYPVLGGTDLWIKTLSFFGGLTMLVAAAMALRFADMKRVLAYTTISALGVLCYSLASPSEIAIIGAVSFLVTHACYKGALFMVAGAVDHQSGSRNLGELGGLRKNMPFTAAAAALAGLSMSGIPPFIGFVAKEIMYEGKLSAESWGGLFLSFVTALLTVSAAAYFILKAFWGEETRVAAKAKEASFGLLLGPVCLALAGTLFGVFIPWVGPELLMPAVVAVLGGSSSLMTIAVADFHWSLWHGFSAPLGLSVLTVGIGALCYAGRVPLLETFRPLSGLNRYSPRTVFDRVLSTLLQLCAKVSDLIQYQPIRNYTLVILVFSMSVLAYSLHSLELGPLSFTKLALIDVVLAVVMALAAGAALVTDSRLAAIAELGVVGLGVTVFFVIYGAPDLAMTQVLVEILSIILFALVVYRIPLTAVDMPFSTRMRNGFVAGVGGVMMGVVTFIAVSRQAAPTISSFFGENSFLSANGKNVVNVILVDFRGIDTLGEITVLGIAAVGVYSMLKHHQIGEESS